MAIWIDDGSTDDGVRVIADTMDELQFVMDSTHATESGPFTDGTIVGGLTGAQRLSWISRGAIPINSAEFDAKLQQDQPR